MLSFFSLVSLTIALLKFLSFVRFGSYDITEQDLAMTDEITKGNFSAIFYRIYLYLYLCTCMIQILTNTGIAKKFKGCLRMLNFIIY